LLAAGIIILTLWRGYTPSIPRLKEQGQQYKKVLDSNRSFVYENSLIAKKYQGFRQYITDKEVHYNQNIYYRNKGVRNLHKIPPAAPLDTSMPCAIRSAFYVAWDPQSFFSLQRNISKLNLVIPEWMFINPNTDTELMLITGPLTVISLQMIFSLLSQRMPAFTAITLGTLISGLAWILLIVHPTVPMAIATLITVAIGEITQSPRYYEYVSRLAPPGQQGTYMGFAFLPIGIGSLIGGKFGGMLIHHFGEVTHQPERIWWSVTGVGVATAALLWIYDRTLRKQEV